MVTVLTAVYNGERFLCQTIESVLGQTYRDFEFVVVDDGSTDGSADLAARYADPRIRIIRSDRNVGLPAALNLGLQTARGDLIARQDADDLAHPERLEKQVAFLRANHDVALVGTRGRLIDDEGRDLGRLDRCLDEVSIRWYHLLDNAFIHTSVMFRHEVVWRELGGYDASLPSSEDYELWGRVIRSHGARNLPDILVSHRLSNASKMAGDERIGPKRAGFHAILRRLVGRHIADALGSDAVSATEAELVGGFAVGVEPPSVGEFIAVFWRLLECFQTRYPECLESRDFRTTLARQIDAIAFRLVPSDRRVAAWLYGAGLRRHPFLLWHMPWARALALLMFGKSGRGWIRRLRLSAAA